MFPPHLTVGRVAPRGQLSIRITAVVLLQISEEEATVSSTFKKKLNK